VLWAFGTVAWPHSRTYFTEPLAGLLALLALDALCRWFVIPLGAAARAGERRRHLLVLGACLALGHWTRMDSPALSAGVLGVLVVGGEFKRLSENMRLAPRARFPLAEYAVPVALAAVSYGLLVAFNAWRFDAGGSLVGGGYKSQSEGVVFSTPLLVGLHGYLASPGKGLFFFSPALVLGVWGWLRLPADRRWVGLAFVGAYLPFVIAMAKWQNWDGGWCWGPRHIVQVHAPLMLGAVFLFEGTGAACWCRAFALRFALAAGALVQLYGSSQSSMEFYHEFYRTPADGLAYTLPYREVELMAIAPHFDLRALDPATGEPFGPASPLQFPAPMVDSLYIPAHTQWNGYAVLWAEGRCDWWLAWLWRGGRETPAAAAD
jgi:hypothetical protein